MVMEMGEHETVEMPVRGDGPPSTTWHNVGGKEPDGKPTRIGKWTFETKMVRDVVLSHLPHGRVLNACAGETELHKRGCGFVRNDIDEPIAADHHHDVCEIDAYLPHKSFAAVILDPPFDPGRSTKLYEGMHGSDYDSARDALAPLVEPGGIAIELGWNSWSFGGIDGWEWVDHHLFRQASFKGDVHLCVARKVNQQTLGDTDA
jgi:hypothetical protein